MNWFEVIKENRLTSQNITHTKVNEDPVVNEDDRCKKKLREILFRFRNDRSRVNNGQFLSFTTAIPTEEPIITMDIKIDGQLNISGSSLNEPDALPSEEDCCVILEEIAKLGQVDMEYTNDGYTMTFHEFSGKKLPTWGSVYGSAMAYYTDKNGEEVKLADLDEEDGEPKKVARRLNVSKYLMFNHKTRTNEGWAESIFEYEITVMQIVDLDYNSQLDMLHMDNKWFLLPVHQCSETMEKVEAKFSEMIR